MLPNKIGRQLQTKKYGKSLGKVCALYCDRLVASSYRFCGLSIGVSLTKVRPLFILDY